MQHHVCGRCPARWSGSGIAHCAGCHQTFTTVRNFEKHFARGGCADPAAQGMVRNERGQWHLDKPRPTDL